MIFTDRPLDALFLETVDHLAGLSGKETIDHVLKKIVDAFGLKNAAYLALNLPGRSHREPYIATTYASDWVKHYQSRLYHRHDPVVIKGVASILPLNWSEFDLSARRVKLLFGEAKDFGVGRNGMSFPIRGRYGEQALFSITSDDSDSEWTRKSILYMRDFQVIAYHVHRMVLRTEGVSAPNVRLAPREIDCLRWAALGKTTSEMASILGIKPRTVRFYLELARDKLGAVNITNAVAKAISLNIISGGL